MRTQLSKKILLLCLICMSSVSTCWAANQNLAPNFENLPVNSKIVLMPPDVELYSLSAGGVAEPKADWTSAAQKNILKSMTSRTTEMNLNLVHVSENEADDFADINALYGAVASSIANHHTGNSVLNLPTKANKLDWSMGDAVTPLQQSTHGDYALFVWVRDSYASAERKAAMVALALLGVGITGGIQVGYASLVDLKTGQVVWFNQMLRMSGDLREEVSTKETMAELLKNFPGAK
jgi:hypothetical protein